MDLERLLATHVAVPAGLAGFDSKQFPAHGGVYGLADGEGRLIQLAATENLRRALTIRLQPAGEDRSHRRADLGAITRHVRYVGTGSQFETMYQFHRLARQLMPDDYLDQVAFGPAWFVHVDADEERPRFIASTFPFDKKGTVVGPFPGRSAATQFIELNEDLFDLCRYYDVLAKSPRGEPCAYFEMGKCPAPCDGSIPLSEYRRMVTDAARFAAGDRAPFLEALGERMREASEKLAFERAAAIKQALERADRINAKAYRLVRPIERFNFLIVQRAGGRSRVKPFFVHRGHITPGPEATCKQFPERTAEWIQSAATEPPVSEPIDPAYRAEEAWLVSHFLFKADRVPGLYLAADELPDAGALAEMVVERFRLAGGKGPSASGEEVDPAYSGLTMLTESEGRTEEAE